MLDDLLDEAPNGAFHNNDPKVIKEAADKFKDDTKNDSQKLFGAVDQILRGKTHTVVRDEFNTWYNQMFVNTALSQYIDTVLFAYEMNLCGGISDQAHFDYLFYGVKSANRPRTKWAKLEDKAEEILLVAVFGRVNQINRDKAKEYLSFLPESNVAAFKKKSKDMALDILDEVLKRFTKADRGRVKTQVEAW